MRKTKQLNGNNEIIKLTNNDKIINQNTVMNKITNV